MLRFVIYFQHLPKNENKNQTAPDSLCPERSSCRVYPIPYAANASV